MEEELAVSMLQSVVSSCLYEHARVCTCTYYRRGCSKRRNMSYSHPEDRSGDEVFSRINFLLIAHEHPGEKEREVLSSMRDGQPRLKTRELSGSG